MSIEMSLVEDSISNLDYDPPLMTDPNTSLRQAIQILREQKHGCLLICEDEKLLGIFTERDILMKILKNNEKLDQPVRQFMTTHPVTIQTKDPVAKAIKLMRKGGYRHIPILDDMEKITGILSVKNIVHYLVDHFPEAVYNLPPEPGEYVDKPEGA